MLWRCCSESATTRKAKTTASKRHKSMVSHDCLGQRPDNAFIISLGHPVGWCPSLLQSGKYGRQRAGRLGLGCYWRMARRNETTEHYRRHPEAGRRSETGAHGRHRGSQNIKSWIRAVQQYGLGMEFHQASATSVKSIGSSRKTLWASPSKSPEERARGACVRRGVRACKIVIEQHKHKP